MWCHKIIGKLLTLNTGASMDILHFCQKLLLLSIHTIHFHRTNGHSSRIELCPCHLSSGKLGTLEPLFCAQCGCVPFNINLMVVIDWYTELNTYNVYNYWIIFLLISCRKSHVELLEMYLRSLWRQRRKPPAAASATTKTTATTSTTTTSYCLFYCWGYYCFLNPSLPSNRLKKVTSPQLLSSPMSLLPLLWPSFNQSTHPLSLHHNFYPKSALTLLALLHTLGCRL